MTSASQVVEDVFFPISPANRSSKPWMPYIKQTEDRTERRTGDGQPANLNAGAGWEYVPRSSLCLIYRRPGDGEAAT